MSRIARASEFKSFWMRSNCRESFRLRSTRLFCSSRKPEICRVMYPEYTNTAARVMISPKNNPGVGDRWGASEPSADERGTPREYNADGLIYQPHQRRAQFVRLKSKGTRLGLVANVALGVNQVKAIGPARVGLLGRIAELIDYRGNLDAEFPHTRPCQQRALSFTFRAGKNNFVFQIALHLPDVAGMCLRDVNDQEGNFAPVLLVKLVESGNLPPERRSSITAKDQNHGLPLRRQGGELHGGALVELHQREVGCRVANLQVTGPSARPQGFKRKEEKGDWARQLRHEPPEGFRRLAHDLVERAAVMYQGHSDHRERSDQCSLDRYSLYAQIHLAILAKGQPPPAAQASATCLVFRLSIFALK